MEQAWIRLAGALIGLAPGRRVTGVVLRDDDLEVHVVGRYGVSVAEIAAEVRRAVEPYAGDRTVHVIIEDLA
jgi:hypothetical protein